MVKDIEQYVHYWSQRFREEEERARIRVQQRLKALPQAVEILQKYGCRRIILFGSLVREGRHISERSDIDLAVEGLPPEKFFSALGELMLSLPFPVDLKPLEEVDPFLKRMILEHGKIIYEQEKRSKSPDQ